MWRAPFLLLLTILYPLHGQVKFAPHKDRISIAINGKPYSDFYLATDGNKPYLFPLSTAGGIVVTRGYPMKEIPGETHDHPHHRGMFFAHGDINGVNFWATEPGTKDPKKGRMALKKIVKTTAGARSGTMEAVFDGLDPAGKPMMTETRTLTFYSDPEMRVIDVAVRIEALQKLTFGDTKEGTFGIRLATPLSEDRTGKMVNAAGASTETNVWGKRSPWVDYFGQVDGKTVGVAIMDHPSNPRHPTYWHARAYGLFAANIFGVKDFTGDKTKDGSMTVQPGHSLNFRYRVIVHSGDVESSNIAGLYSKFVTEK